jgi:hypothetical protein
MHAHCHSHARLSSTKSELMVLTTALAATTSKSAAEATLSTQSTASASAFLKCAQVTTSGTMTAATASALHTVTALKLTEKTRSGTLRTADASASLSQILALLSRLGLSTIASALRPRFAKNPLHICKSPPIRACALQRHANRVRLGASMNASAFVLQSPAVKTNTLILSPALAIASRENALPTKSGTLVFVLASVLHQQEVASQATTSARRIANANAPTESAPTSMVSHNTSTLVIASASANLKRALTTRNFGILHSASASAPLRFAL